jgi:hypothetical protein
MLKLELLDNHEARKPDEPFPKLVALNAQNV